MSTSYKSLSTQSNLLLVKIIYLYCPFQNIMNGKLSLNSFTIVAGDKLYTKLYIIIIIIIIIHILLELPVNLFRI